MCSSILGFIETYAILHCTMWWLLNIGALFWKIQFPFHSRYYDSTRRTQYIHLGCVIVAIVLPVYAPISIAAKSGFVIPRFPPIVCLPRNAEENFYALIAPISILFAAGTTLLLLILRKIRQVTNSLPFNIFIDTRSPVFDPIWNSLWLNLEWPKWLLILIQSLNNQCSACTHSARNGLMLLSVSLWRAFSYNYYTGYDPITFSFHSLWVATSGISSYTLSLLWPK